MWTYEKYEESIRAYLDRGYSVGSFRDYLANPTIQCVVLRHDIDFDPGLLEPMLEVERKLGVHSTTFFRVVAKKYNFMSVDIADIVSTIQRAGAEVGLHLDIGMEKVWGGTAAAAADTQRTVFQETTKARDFGFALHQPGKSSAYGFADTLAESWGSPYHAYDQLFFRTFKFLSDSGGRWREGHWSEFVGEHERLQVLTHPIWHHDGRPQRSF